MEGLEGGDDVDWGEWKAASPSGGDVCQKKEKEKEKEKEPGDDWTIWTGPTTVSSAALPPEAPSNTFTPKSSCFAPIHYDDLPAEPDRVGRSLQKFANLSQMSDVTLRLKNQSDEQIATLGAHRLYLCLGSEYFRALLMGSWKDSDKKVLDVSTDLLREIFDSDAFLLERFRQFLVYLHTEQLPRSLQLAKENPTEPPVTLVRMQMKEAWELYMLAQFYGSENLQRACEDALTNWLLSRSSVCEMWNTAHAVGCDRVARMCLRYIEDHFDSTPPTPAYAPYYSPITATSSGHPIWKAEGWDILDKPLLLAVLSSDKLTLPNEYSVWEAMVAWAKGNARDKTEEEPVRTTVQPPARKEGEAPKQGMRMQSVLFAVVETFETMSRAEKLLEDLVPHLRFNLLFHRVPDVLQSPLLPKAFKDEATRRKIQSSNSLPRVGRASRKRRQASGYPTLSSADPFTFLLGGPPIGYPSAMSPAAPPPLG